MTQRTAAVPFDSDARWLFRRGLPAALATSAVLGFATYFLCTLTVSWML